LYKRSFCPEYHAVGLRYRAGAVLSSHLPLGVSATPSRSSSKGYYAYNYILLRVG
jgi:hypothetical protein